MENKLKKESFRDGLHRVLGALEVEQQFKVDYAQLKYTQDLICKWNKAHPTGPNYKVRCFKLVNDTSVCVMRVK